MVSFFEIKLRELIKETEEKYNLYTYMGWDTSWIKELRHTYLKCLLKEQIKTFNRID